MAKDGAVRSGEDSVIDYEDGLVRDYAEGDEETGEAVKREEQIRDYED